MRVERGADSILIALFKMWGVEVKFGEDQAKTYFQNKDYELLMIELTSFSYLAWRLPIESFDH
jgi:hypothetical protein